MASSTDGNQDLCPWCGDEYRGPMDGHQLHTQYTKSYTENGIMCAAWVYCPRCGCHGPTAFISIDIAEETDLKRARRTGLTLAEEAQKLAWEKWRKGR